VDKVEDILRSSELYVSQVKEDYRMKTDEPVVSDLITALLSVGSETITPYIFFTLFLTENTPTGYNRIFKKEQQ